MGAGTGVRTPLPSAPYAAAPAASEAMREGGRGPVDARRYVVHHGEAEGGALVGSAGCLMARRYGRDRPGLVSRDHGSVAKGSQKNMRSYLSPS